MSRIFSKLKEVPIPAAVPKTREFPNLLVFGIVTVLAVAFVLGSLSSNVGTIKNSIFLSMDADIQQQQNQILALNKKLLAMQSSNLKLIQAALKADHREAVLQATINELNTSINKLKE